MLRPPSDPAEVWAGPRWPRHDTGRGETRARRAGWTQHRPGEAGAGAEAAGPPPAGHAPGRGAAALSPHGHRRRVGSEGDESLLGRAGADGKQGGAGLVQARASSAPTGHPPADPPRAAQCFLRTLCASATRRVSTGGWRRPLPAGPVNTPGRRSPGAERSTCSRVAPTSTALTAEEPRHALHASRGRLTYRLDWSEPCWRSRQAALAAAPRTHACRRPWLLLTSPSASIPHGPGAALQLGAALRAQRGEGAPSGRPALLEEPSLS